MTRPLGVGQVSHTAYISRISCACLYKSAARFARVRDGRRYLGAEASSRGRGVAALRVRDVAADAGDHSWVEG
jgi:hypothetical protein